MPEPETTPPVTRVEVDLNVRAHGNQARVGFEDADGPLQPGQTVEVFESESGLTGVGTVTAINTSTRLAWIAVNWPTLAERPACTWPSCLTPERQTQLAEQVTAAEHDETTTPMPDQRIVCGCTEAASEPDETDATEADIDRMMAAGIPVQIITEPPGTTGGESILLNLTESGVATPGCDCGHDGMGTHWHANDCAWKAGGAPVPAPSVPALRDTLAAWCLDHALADLGEQAVLDSLVAVVRGQMAALLAEADEAQEALIAAQAAVARVWTLHARTEERRAFDLSLHPIPTCAGCGERWPCPTIAALAPPADQPDTGGAR